MYETAKETVMYRTVLWTLWERERVARFGRMALKHFDIWQKKQVLMPRLKRDLLKRYNKVFSVLSSLDFNFRPLNIF